LRRQQNRYSCRFPAGFLRNFLKSFSQKPICVTPQHFLYFLPLPQGQGSLRLIFSTFLGCALNHRRVLIAELSLLYFAMQNPSGKAQSSACSTLPFSRRPDGGGVRGQRHPVRRKA
jgi:hypothetical protein